MAGRIYIVCEGQSENYFVKRKFPEKRVKPEKSDTILSVLLKPVTLNFCLCPSLPGI